MDLRDRVIIESFQDELQKIAAEQGLEKTAFITGAQTSAIWAGLKGLRHSIPQKIGMVRAGLKGSRAENLWNFVRSGGRTSGRFGNIGAILRAPGDYLRARPWMKASKQAGKAYDTASQWFAGASAGLKGKGTLFDRLGRAINPGEIPGYGRKMPGILDVGEQIAETYRRTNRALNPQPSRLLRGAKTAGKYALGAGAIGGGALLYGGLTQDHSYRPSAGRRNYLELSNY